MDKKTKIFTAGFVAVFGALVFLGAGCGTLMGPLTTEDKCVELMAQSLTGMQSAQGGDMAAAEAWQEKIDNLKKQYGWSDEEITSNCQKFPNQKDFMDRVGERMKKLLGK